MLRRPHLSGFGSFGFPLIALLFATVTGSISAQEPLHQRIDKLIAAAHTGPVAPTVNDEEFMRRVRAVFRDGRLTVDEVSGLNVYIERVIEESGMPPMQLGEQAPNTEPVVA